MYMQNITEYHFSIRESTIRDLEYRIVSHKKGILRCTVIKWGEERMCVHTRHWCSLLCIRTGYVISYPYHMYLLDLLTDAIPHPTPPRIIGLRLKYG